MVSKRHEIVGKWSGNGLKWSGSDHEMAINGQVVVLKGHEMA